MTVRCGLTVAVVMVASCGACSDAANPASTPTPTSTPTQIVGRPQATALENLVLVRSLEKATGRDSILVWISTAAANERGRSNTGSAWIYKFALANSDDPRTYQWSVWADGKAEFSGEGTPPFKLEYAELEPLLHIDSDRAVALALDYGGRAFVQRYPGALFSMICRRIGRRPVWDMRIHNISAAPFNCTEDVVLDADDGSLLAHTSAPCL